MSSALTLILATIASLRAVSRLQRRLLYDGSIGMMIGPPILGPRVIPNATVRENTDSSLDGKDRIQSEKNEGNDNVTVEASPLWEHTEYFRRAVTLGLIFDDSETNTSNSIFSDIVRIEGQTINIQAESEEGDESAVAVKAGLFVRSKNREARSSSRVRGGGLNVKPMQQNAKGKVEHSSWRNPVGLMTHWFIRELSAPMAAIYAWHGLFCSYLREKKETRLRRSQWCLLTPWEKLQYILTGRSNGKKYNPSGLDFNASVSAVTRPPYNTRDLSANGSLHTRKTVHVKAFAPKTFRNLRNKCFKVNEKEYAKSILNTMNGEVSMEAIHRYDEGVPLEMAHDDKYDSTLSHVLQEIIHGKPQRKRRTLRGSQTLPYISFQSNSKGAARAGTFFFFTADGAYMIKTVKREEAKAFLEMLPEYHRFMSEGVNSRNSLLNRIFGMYSVQFPSEPVAQFNVNIVDRWDGGLFTPSGDHLPKIHDDERVYLVMHSVFPPEASVLITERFDLKGSTVGRECSLEERRSKGVNAVLKDLNLKREVAEELCGGKDAEKPSDKQVKNKSHYGICLGRRSKTTLMAQLVRDVDLLQRCNVLDYSLLVGVADLETVNGSVERRVASQHVPKCLQNLFQWMDFPMPYYGAGMTAIDGTTFSSVRGTRKGKQVMYYLGVIDFLQPWTVKKRLERDLKGLAGYDKTAISCVAPSDYATRFLKFIDSHVT